MRALSALDRAAAAAEADGAGSEARARLYALLRATTLHAPVEDGAEGDGPAPVVFPLAEATVALAFDDDARLAAFFEKPTRFVAAPGRVLLDLLAEVGLGLAVNPDAEPGVVLPPETVAWIAREMGDAPETADLSGPLTLGPPLGAPAGLVEALAGGVANLPGIVAEAWLVRLGAAGGAGPDGLAALLLPAPAGRRAAEGAAGWLAPVAEAHATAGETVSIGLVEEGHPLLGPARARGLPLHATEGPRTQAKAAPPRLR